MVSLHEIVTGLFVLLEKLTLIQRSFSRLHFRDLPFLIADDSSVKEEMEILQEKLSQYQVKNSEIIQNNKDLKEENTELLDRLRTQQNDVAELKAR